MGEQKKVGGVQDAVPSGLPHAWLCPRAGKTCWALRESSQIYSLWIRQCTKLKLARKLEARRIRVATIVYRITRSDHIHEADMRRH
jgi:hypothetical protein